jgi:hypothetical protein
VNAVPFSSMFCRSCASSMSYRSTSASNHWELEVRFGNVVDVIDPFSVRAEIICALGSSCQHLCCTLRMFFSDGSIATGREVPIYTVACPLALVYPRSVISPTG